MLPEVASSDRWRTFVHQCLAYRVDVDEFKTLSQAMLIRFPLKDHELLHILLDARAASAIAWDPLVPAYIDGLCRAGQVKSPSALASLLKHSSICDRDAQNRKISTLMTDIKVIQDVMLSISTGIIPRSNAEAGELYYATVEWINAVVAWHNTNADASQQTDGPMNSPDAVSLVESLGILLAALSGTAKGLETLSSDTKPHQGMSLSTTLYRDWLTDLALKIKLGQALSAYLPLCVDVSLPLRQRLDALQKEFNLFGEQPSKSLDHPAIEEMNINALQFEASVLDGPVINTRAGLYVYLNSMVNPSLLFFAAMLIVFPHLACGTPISR